MALARRTSRTQDRKYWEGMAGRWDDEILNTLKADRRGVIPAELQRGARRGSSVIDYGCGTGIYLPLLGRLFEAVIGIDRSPACIKVAKERVRGKENITAGTAASIRPGHRGRFDVVLCVNVALHPSPRAHLGVLRSAVSLLGARGRLILVVPSFESAKLVIAAEKPAAAVPKRQADRPVDWVRDDGIATIDGVATKHFAKTEIRDALTGLGVQVARIKRVEYSWQSQGVVPSAKFRRTLPWDWLVIADLPQAAGS